jgi:hypothetical protein
MIPTLQNSSARVHKFRCRLNEKLLAICNSCRTVVILRFQKVDSSIDFVFLITTGYAGVQKQARSAQDTLSRSIARVAQFLLYLKHCYIANVNAFFVKEIFLQF